MIHPTDIILISVFIMYFLTFVWKYYKIKRHTPSGEVLMQMYLAIEYQKYRKKRKFI